MAPPEPEFVEQTGLAESTLERHVLKSLYFRGDVYDQDLSNAVGLRFRVTQEIVENLKLRHHIQIKKSLGVGNVASLFSLTETGRTPAREYLESNRYAGPAPVPIEQYVAPRASAAAARGLADQAEGEQWNLPHRRLGPAACHAR